MMNINSMDGTNINMQMGQKNFLSKGTDSVGKGIQKQIENAQKQLQDLASNKEMGMEEKMKKRQEIQEQINDLNKQLRQHQIDQRQEMQKTKAPSTDTISGSNKEVGASKAGNKGTGLSQASMTAMISADSAIGQAKHMDSVITQTKGRKNTLAMEIKLDAQRGRDVEAKQGELEDLENRIMKAEASQIESLGTANKEMEEASKADQQAEKAGNSKKDKKAENKEDEDKDGESTLPVSEKTITDTENEIPDFSSGVYYTKIDVRL